MKFNFKKKKLPIWFVENKENKLVFLNMYTMEIKFY